MGKPQSILRTTVKQEVLWKDRDVKLRFKIEEICLAEIWTSHIFIVKLKEGEKELLELFRFGHEEGEWKITRIPPRMKKQDKCVDLTMSIGECDKSTTNRKKECKLFIQTNGDTVGIAQWDVAQFGTGDDPKVVRIELKEKLKGSHFTFHHQEITRRGI